MKEYELLAILLDSGTQGKDVIKLSKDITSILDKEFEAVDLKKTHFHPWTGQSQSDADTFCYRTQPPSRQCFPSHEDKMVTRRLKEVGKIMGIELLDHIIITREGYFSFHEEGAL